MRFCTRKSSARQSQHVHEVAAKFPVCNMLNFLKTLVSSSQESSNQ